MNKLTLKLFILTTVSFYTDSSFSQISQFRDAVIDSTVNAFREKWGIPGISVAIAKDGRLIYAKGMGLADTATMEPVTPHSLFRIASCSKTITAIGIMKLIQDKRLGIDDTVFGNTGILDGYKNIPDERILKITVKNLLQQTVGWQEEDIVGANVASYALRHKKYTTYKGFQREDAPQGRYVIAKPQPERLLATVHVSYLIAAFQAATAYMWALHPSGVARC